MSHIVDLDVTSLAEISETHDIFSKDYVGDLQNKVTDLHQRLTETASLLGQRTTLGDLLIDRTMELARALNQHWLVTLQEHWTTDLRTTLEKCNATLTAFETRTPHQLNPIDLNSDPLQ